MSIRIGPPLCLALYDTGYGNKGLPVVVNSGAFWDPAAEWFVSFKVEAALLAWMHQRGAPECAHIRAQYLVEQL